MPATRIDVAAAAGPYPVIVGAGALASLRQLLDESGLGPERIVVSSPAVWELHGTRLPSLTDGRRRAPVLVSDGERHKTLQTVG
ncbi:MAG: 3-dehydroquinate synthase, partial [Acidobacteriota bacterium]|nr:3-dehydroquinate synthase [Acidobacteriota bacterium]